jgi:hypothetical protein
MPSSVGTRTIGPTSRPVQPIDPNPDISAPTPPGRTRVPALFAGRAEAFAVDVRDAVLGLCPSGLLTEPFRVEVLVAACP